MWGCALDKVPVDRRATYKENHAANLEFTIRLKWIYLDSGRKPENPEKRTHSGTGGTCKVHTEKLQAQESNPQPFFWCEGNNAHHCTQVETKKMLKFQWNVAFTFTNWKKALCDLKNSFSLFRGENIEFKLLGLSPTRDGAHGGLTSLEHRSKKLVSLRDLEWF